ncbi:hypothetical protein K491DRAFT_706395 [Lophiostoma macrostomum CBS 122681]|uniref:Uncharacterized protein n=1 Tax=Lophiostoma macrostomum CBS 122681 TaxID=1314788 RepID=A0A6A6SY53_9PLEO|nr:hypothetical protein K491DRAFT_706395 [Lophiostoma macrostomum CBS 122681]
MPPPLPTVRHGPPRAGKARTSKAGRRVSECRALLEDGSDCRQKLSQPKHTLCPSHYHEHKQLHQRYKDKERDYRNLQISQGEADPKETLEAKLSTGRQTLDLRDQVNRRFFALSASNRGHVKWILKLQAEIRDLEQQLAQLDNTRSLEENVTGTRTRLSLLNSAVPITALSHLPQSSPIPALKRALAQYPVGMVDELYRIAPSLDDSSSVILHGVNEDARKPTARDHVIRFLFRELLVHKADVVVLERAHRTRSIDTFLHESSGDDLERYIKFFKAFDQGREDTLHLLRDAVCDYSLAVSPSSSTIILGDTIVTENHDRSMNTAGWDTLWEHFRDHVDWSQLELCAFHFEDILRVKVLIACLRYGPGKERPNWYHPTKDMSQKSVPALMLGFLALNGDVVDSAEHTTQSTRSSGLEMQERGYLVGRMSKKNSFAQPLARELSERVARFHLLVFDRGHKPGQLETLPPSSECENLWIRRTRLESPGSELSASPWSIELSLPNILQNLELKHDMQNSDMTTEYYEFVIIDRIPGRDIDILDVVADALMKLKSDPPYRDVFSGVIQKYIPPDEQDNYLRAIAKMDLDKSTPGQYCRYEGSRVRCWDSRTSRESVLEATLQKSSRATTWRDSRLISQISADLEAHNVIKQCNEYEPPYTCPIVLPSTDGLGDIYFRFDLGSMNAQAFRGSILDFDPSTNTLFEFCQAYQRTNPKAVFARGTINVHYCAWPMPMLPGTRYAHLNFSTPEGRLYKWNALPFDMPMASRIWQWFVNLEINSKLPFVRLVQTTLIICAEKETSANASLKALFDVGEKHGWTFSIPAPEAWTADFASLSLDTLWHGARPAYHS